MKILNHYQKVINKKLKCYYKICKWKENKFNLIKIKFYKKLNNNIKNVLLCSKKKLQQNINYLIHANYH
jgi:phosphatidate phosphatase PAH1